jgi:hypothetical protein
VPAEVRGERAAQDGGVITEIDLREPAAQGGGPSGGLRTAPAVLEPRDVVAAADFDHLVQSVRADLARLSLEVRQAQRAAERAEGDSAEGEAADAGTAEQPGPDLEAQQAARRDELAAALAEAQIEAAERVAAARAEAEELVAAARSQPPATQPLVTQAPLAPQTPTQPEVAEAASIEALAALVAQLLRQAPELGRATERVAAPMDAGERPGILSRVMHLDVVLPLLAGLIVAIVIVAWTV